MTNFPGMQVDRNIIGNDAIDSMVITNNVTGTDRPPLTAVFGNGAFGSIGTFGPVIREFLYAAEANGQPVHAVTYKDPWLGTGEYAQSYRSERLAEVVVAQAYESPIHVVGHSWGWPPAIDVAYEIPEHIAALEGYSPTGHININPRSFKWSKVIRSALKEALQIEATQVRTSIKSMGTMAVALPGRVLFSNLLEESEQVFADNITDEVVALRRKHGIPMGVILAEKDAFFGPKVEDLAKLHEAGVISRRIDSTHLGAVIEPKHGQELYGLVSDLAE